MTISLDRIWNKHNLLKQVHVGTKQTDHYHTFLYIRRNLKINSKATGTCFWYTKH